MNVAIWHPLLTGAGVVLAGAVVVWLVVLWCRAVRREFWT